MAGSLQNANSNDITSVISTLGQRANTRAKDGKSAEQLSGPRRAAILMLALGEQYGGKIWQLLAAAAVRLLLLEMSTRGAGARYPPVGPGARRRQSHAEDGGGAERGDRARRADVAHRIHVEPVAD